MKLSERLSAYLERPGKEEIKERGYNIYYYSDPELISLDLEDHFAEYRVQSQRYYRNYAVELSGFDKPQQIKCRCNCPDERNIICEHGYAAMFAVVDELQEIEREQFPEITEEIEEEPVIEVSEKSDKRAIYAADPLHINSLPELTDVPYSALWEVQHWLYSLKHVKLDGNKLSGELREGKTLYRPSITLSADQILSSNCNCQSKSRPLCKHAYALLVGFARSKGCEQDVIFFLRDHTAAVASRLAEYGYAPDDDWQELFDVHTDYPEVRLVPRDPGLSMIAEFAPWKQEIDLFVRPDLEIYPDTFTTTKPNYGILWSYSPLQETYLYLNLMVGKRKKNGDLGSPLRLIDPAQPLSEDYNQDQLLLLNLLNGSQLMRELHSWGWGRELSLSNPKDFPAYENRHRRILSILPEILYEEHYFCEEALDRNTIPSGKTKRIYPQETTPQLSFELRKSKGYVSLTPFISVEEKKIPLIKANFIGYGVLKVDQKLFVLDEMAARTIVFFRRMDAYKVRQEDFKTFNSEFLEPLSEYFEVVRKGINDTILEITSVPKKKIYLKEVEDHLLLIPALTYESEDGLSGEVNLDGGRVIYVKNKKGRTLALNRDRAFEEEVRAEVVALHPKFRHFTHHYFPLPVEQVMRNNWFFKAFELLRKQGYEVLGLKKLKALKYSPFRPQVRLQASSGTDWFDLEMEVTFGEQRVKLSEIRKAVLNNQQYIKLDDGSIGILPDEWLKKYSSLFKIGKVAKDNIKISEFQLNLIDDLYQEIDNGEIFESFLEKREKLKEFKKIRKAVLPKDLKAELRKYQVAGYNWLNFLDEFSWGGCLADDMGLGKTVQMLAFLMRVSEQHPGATHLIVVPRSLVFNWINEVEKFCPGFTVLRHTGSSRNKDSAIFADYDLVITTYGLARSDIKVFREFEFHYVILDESQAIKNPTTQTAKAVKLLKAKNRLIMTGTPIENNIFDLYSQMDFVNPGMLGSLEGFRREFATPIDKDKDEAVAVQLRKLVYPFILSRKKQEVAKELPEKTETVLYCEMPKAQRKVYDYYKDKYRNLLQDVIETQGFGKAGMYVLQGLLKLRQICNSATLLTEEDKQFTDESAKMELLLEMLEEIFAEGHKVLIFSFFKGMLNLVGEELAKREVDFVQLTGESQNREELVDTFKSDTDKKAFLISLKAGGFGLNLTEANYVFLIDPWWNPAVEQQAIDRTHRIGQEDKVFAYKMICKDTIEEKILQLQERKKALATEIIHTESGFLKSLKPKDVKELFS